MKTKTINKILTGKFTAWANSISDENVRKLVEKNTIISGGSIVSMLLNEEVNDFDIYFRDADTALAVAKYYVAELLKNPPPAFKDDLDHTIKVDAILEPAVKAGDTANRINGLVDGPLPPRVRVVVKSAGIAGETKQSDYQYFEGIQDANQQANASENYVAAAIGGVDNEDGSGFDGEFVEGQVTDTSEPDAYVNAVSELDEHTSSTIKDAGELKAGDGKRNKYRVQYVTSNAITLSDQIQIVLRFQGDPEEIHKNYDFVHCTNYWVSDTKKLVLRQEALECILAKELRYIGSRYPLCSVIRLRKFISRGWTVNAGQILKMLFQVSQLDLTDPVVLEDQLVGVDSAYFSQVIAKLKDRVDENGKPINVDGTYLCTLIDKIF